jgi:hypothetical protein
LKSSMKQTRNFLDQSEANRIKLNISLNSIIAPKLSWVTSA